MLANKPSIKSTVIHIEIALPNTNRFSFTNINFNIRDLFEIGSISRLRYFYNVLYDRLSAGNGYSLISYALVSLCISYLLRFNTSLVPCLIDNDFLTHIKISQCCLSHAPKTILEIHICTELIKH
uniref:Uncharacterized protein n=1 Tax=Glossina pallidipes TaxID=7398 RepID=A0A1A9ZJW2_GLOPL